ncbi:hypothetical protein INR49_001494 [Caranx melampygus]|nr:hypothetical protein INR49_001494 [Caranx melampygus]
MANQIVPPDMYEILNSFFPAGGVVQQCLLSSLGVGRLSIPMMLQTFQLTAFYDDDLFRTELCRYWLQGQRAGKQLAAIAVSLNSSAGLGGSGRGRGRGYTEKGEDYTPRGGGWKSETLPA